MNLPVVSPTIPDVRVKLDNLIGPLELRIDNMEVALADFPANYRPPQLATRLDHALGRLHGLKEARELLNELEAPAPRTWQTDLAEDR